MFILSVHNMQINLTSICIFKESKIIEIVLVFEPTLKNQQKKNENKTESALHSDIIFHLNREILSHTQGLFDIGRRSYSVVEFKFILDELSTNINIFITYFLSY